MRPVLGLLGPFFLFQVHAQLEIPTRVTMTGSDPQDRQVVGLADPAVGDAAVSVDASRAGSMSTTSAQGSGTLVCTLVPAPLAYTTGMLITVTPQAANSQGATLDLNGLGPRSIVKWGQVQVDSADLPVGVPSRLVYDGTRFLLLSQTSRPCPPNYSAAGSTYCICDSTVGEGTFFDGVAACEALGGRLCSFGEWSNACLNRPGFLGTVNAYEWVDDAANNPNDAKTVGGGYAGPVIVEGFACEYGYSREPLTPSRYRCCTSR